MPLEYCELIEGGLNSHIASAHKQKRQQRRKFLANFCFSFEGTKCYDSFATLPRKDKGIIILDKEQVPHKIIKRLKRQASYEMIQISTRHKYS